MAAAAALSAWVGPAGAGDDYAAARAVMQQTTERLLKRLHAEADVYHTDEQRLYRMLEEVVVPAVDMRLISRLVLGAHWDAADALQQQRFVKVFQSMLMKSYGKTLLLMSDIRVEYEPPLSGEPRKKYQVVRTKVMASSNKPPLSISYSLVDREGWKIFDIIIDGASIARQFRVGFDREIREVGFEALLGRLGKFGS